MTEASITNALIIVADGTGTTFPMRPREMIRNGVDLDREVLFALDTLDQEILHRHFGERAFWRYERAAEQAAGRLTPVP